MRFFLCLINVEGGTVPDVVRRRYEWLPRSRGLAFQWRSIAQVAVLTSEDNDEGERMVAVDEDWLAIGSVRLDNRADLERWSGCSGQMLSDLQLVCRTVARQGTECVPRFLGDFAFLVWNQTTRRAVAACDILALRKLYYTEGDGVVAFASRAELLALDDRYEARYLAELVAGGVASRELTVYAGVQAVPGGTMLVLERASLTAREYWFPEHFEPDPAWGESEQAVVERCRELLVESVRLRLSATGDTWAQLSGGLDSSSIVSIVQCLAEQGAIPHGLAGTVTFVDREGAGTDEREYANTVVARWRVRNETIVDPPFWYDSSHALPRTDLPGFFLPFYPRERRLCAIVRAAGGRVLVTGQGGDELFTGTMLFFADWLARGRVWPAVREMARRAAIGHVSLWELAYRNAVVPLLPRAIRHLLVTDQGQMPPWVSKSTARRYELHARSIVASSYEGRRGHKYHHAVLANLSGVARAPQYGVIGDVLDVRHPFLYRPLVEFALRLPPELCVRPHARKWVLREAMRGILPEPVRTRIGKASPLELYTQAFTTHRRILQPLLQNPILADLGIVDAAGLRAAFEAAPHQPQRREEPHSAVHSALVVEAWLQMRAGRWPHGVAEVL